MTTIKIIENGPAVISPNPHDESLDAGIIGVQADGFTTLLDTVVAVCRCGKSLNQPYCDGAHKKKEA